MSDDATVVLRLDTKDAQVFQDNVETWVRDYEYYVPVPDIEFSRVLAALKAALAAIFGPAAHD